MKAKPNLLVTGASGLIGSALTERLKDSYQVIGLDLEESENFEGIDFIKCDLTSSESVSEAMSQVKEKTLGRLASVIHLAAYYDFSGAPSDLYEELTVKGSERLLKALNKDFEVEQFVFSSTILTMEPVRPGEELTEESKIKAEWDYPQSKVEAEHIIREEAKNIPVVILRLAGVYDEEGHSPPLCQQMSRIYERKLESHFYPGKQNRGQAFLHLDDLVDLFERVVTARGELGQLEVFLAAEPEVMSYGELQDDMGKLIHGKEWMTIRIPEVVAKVGAWAKDQFSSEEQFIKPWMVDIADDHYPVNIKKAKEELQWEPHHSLKQTLPKMVEHLKNSPEKWYKENGIRNPSH